MPSGPSSPVADFKLAHEGNVGCSPCRVVERLGTWEDKLSREVRKHPGRTVAAALGVGYVLGGGLFSRFTARLLKAGLRMGVRAALVPFIAEGLLRAGEISRRRGRGRAAAG
jgi:hypothetical protein